MPVGVCGFHGRPHAGRGGSARCTVSGSPSGYTVSATPYDPGGEFVWYGAHVIYANGMWRGDDAMGHLMHDFNCNDAAQMYFDILKRQVSQFKNSEEGRRYMCEAMERIRAEGKAEGKAEGGNNKIGA